MAYAVGHHLDENGLATVGEGEGAGGFCGGAHGEDVVAVDADGVHAVAGAAGGDAIATVLVAGGCGDGVAVVAADEDAGCLSCGGDVEGGVEVAFARGAFAEVGDGHTGFGVRVLLVLEFERVGCAGCVGELGCECGGYGPDVEFPGTVVNRHITATTGIVAVGKELSHELVESEASLHEDTGLTVLAEDGVAGAESTGGPDGYAFFSSGYLACMSKVKFLEMKVWYHVET